MQIAVMDSAGAVICNKSFKCDHNEIRTALAQMPANTKYVLESSSVWYGMYRFLTDKLGLDVMLSNPLATKRIAASKKKTDKVDAKILADLLRGGYISGCYVPDKMTVEDRQLVRYRDGIVRRRAQHKNSIHGILLQEGIKIDEQPFTPKFVKRLHKLDDWRVEKHLKIIDFLTVDIRDCDERIERAVGGNPQALLLRTVPGIGNATALTLASEVDDIDRFPDEHRLVSYFGLVPSVRNSAETVHHGRITKTGNSMVRHLLAEAVIVHVSVARRKGVVTPISIFYERLKERRGGSKAKVAAAGKMLKIAYWIMKKKIDFETCVREGEASTYRDPHKKSQR